MKKLVLIIPLLTVLFVIPSLSLAQENDHQTNPCEVEDLFYAVQLGVFSKKIPAEAFPKVAGPIYYIEREDGLFVYFSGLFDCRFAAMRKRYHIKKTGHYDAYVACYYNRQQVNMARADELIEEYGDDILYKPETAQI